MISLTEVAAKKIREQLDRRGHGLGIRVGVKTTGCSGMSYVLEYVDNENLRCVGHYDSYDVRVFVDPKDLVYLDGMTIDWLRQGLNEGFDFINPHEKARCGCGESFKI